MPVPNLIGTKSESSLHRALKFRYTGPDGQTEVEIAGFVADGICANGECIEVQTTNFARVREKFKKLASQRRVRIVYPVILNKYIDVYSKRGKKMWRRKSPLRGNPWNLFDVLCYAPDLPLIPGITIELALVDVQEQRVQDGKGSWRRKGISIKDRELLAWHESISLESPADYLRFVPFEEKEQFTTSMLKEKASITPQLARMTLYTLTKMQVVKRVGKKANAWLYEINRPQRKIN
ncbi:MAG: hypothetical protein LBH97_05860 [Treponema sp.]|nr:hypothetical protein [Treponema sp.]